MRSSPVLACWSNELAIGKRLDKGQHMFDLYTNIYHQTLPHCSDHRVHSFHRLVPRDNFGRLPHLHTIIDVVDTGAWRPLREHNGSICVAGGIGRITRYSGLFASLTDAV